MSYSLYNLDKLGFFFYKEKSYSAGTKVLFTGNCFLNDTEIYLSNVVVEFAYTTSAGYPYEYWVFKYNNNLYKYRYKKAPPNPYSRRIIEPDLEKSILKIVVDEDPNKPKQREMIWTNEMVSATLWYIVIMLVATIFNGRIGIWILATIVWYNYIRKNGRIIEK